jgi:hypothetical protein
MEMKIADPKTFRPFSCSTVYNSTFFAAGGPTLISASPERFLPEITKITRS